MVSKTKERRKSGINTSEPLAGDVGNVSNLSDTEKLKALWLKECHKFTYDPFEKSLDFRRLTDYKLNKRVICTLTRLRSSCGHIHARKQGALG